MTGVRLPPLKMGLTQPSNQLLWYACIFLTRHVLDISIGRVAVKKQKKRVSSRAKPEPICQSRMQWSDERSFDNEEEKRGQDPVDAWLPWL